MCVPRTLHINTQHLLDPFHVQLLVLLAAFMIEQTPTLCMCSGTPHSSGAMINGIVCPGHLFVSCFLIALRCTCHNDLLCQV